MSDIADPFAKLSEGLGAVYDSVKDEDKGAGGVPSSAASPSAEAEPSPSTEPAESPEAAQSNSSGERPRGPDGKFLPKDKAEEVKPEAKPEGDKPAEVKAAEEPKKTEQVSDQSVTGGIQPPTSWSAAAKQEFSKLPLAVQEAVAKREMEVSSGFKQYGERVKSYEAIDNILKPLQPRLQMAGMSSQQFIGQLVAAHNALEQNPQQALVWLARQYGVDPAQVMNPGADPAQQQETNPEIAALKQKIAELESGVTAQKQAAQQAAQMEAQTELQRFASDPKNEFFEQVRQDMGVLISAGKATDLADAYQKACRMNPEVFQIIQAREADRLQKLAREEAAKQAAAARKAATTNVSGTASTPGQVPPMRQLMEATYDRLNGAA